MIGWSINELIDFCFIYLEKGALDVGILLDSSEDISSANWNRITSFTKYLIGTFPKISSSPDGTRFGLITYSRDPAVHFNFRTLQGNRLTRGNVQKLIESAPRRPGTKRRTDSALELAETDLFSTKGGARIGAKRVSTQDSFLPLTPSPHLPILFP